MIEILSSHRPSSELSLMTRQRMGDNPSNVKYLKLSALVAAALLLVDQYRTQRDRVRLSCNPNIDRKIAISF